MTRANDDSFAQLNPTLTMMSLLWWSCSRRGLDSLEAEFKIGIYSYMHLSSETVKPKTRSNIKRSTLNKRLPRMGRVVFSENASPVHCTVKSFSVSGAVLTMTGWMGLPSEFQLYVEPDNIRAKCTVAKRKGSNVEVHFLEIENDIRYRAVA